MLILSIVDLLVFQDVRAWPTEAIQGMRELVAGKMFAMKVRSFWAYLWVFCSYSIGYLWTNPCTGTCPRLSFDCFVLVFPLPSFHGLHTVLVLLLSCGYCHECMCLWYSVMTCILVRSCHVSCITVTCPCFWSCHLFNADLEAWRKESTGRLVWSGLGLCLLCHRYSSLHTPCSPGGRETANYSRLGEHPVTVVVMQYWASGSMPHNVLFLDNAFATVRGNSPWIIVKFSLLILPWNWRQKKRRQQCNSVISGSIVESMSIFSPPPPPLFLSPRC